MLLFHFLLFDPPVQSAEVLWPLMAFGSVHTAADSRVCSLPPGFPGICWNMYEYIILHIFILSFLATYYLPQLLSIAQRAVMFKEEINVSFPQGIKIWMS